MPEFNDLHFAAKRGDTTVVRAFLAQGWDPDVFDEIGLTALHHAARGEHLEVVRVLLGAGANVNAHDESQIGDNPIGAVAGNCSWEMAKALTDAGANPTMQGWMQLSALDRAKDRKREEGKRVYALLCKAATRFRTG